MEEGASAPEERAWLLHDKQSLQGTGEQSSEGPAPQEPEPEPESIPDGVMSVDGLVEDTDDDPLGLRETLSGLAEDSTAESDPFGISPNLPLDDNTPMSPIFSWPIARVASDPSVLPPEPLLLPRPGLSPDQVETLRCS